MSSDPFWSKWTSLLGSTIQEWEKVTFSSNLGWFSLKINEYDNASHVLACTSFVWAAVIIIIIFIIIFIIIILLIL